jgi:hypothetical protein
MVIAHVLSTTRSRYLLLALVDIPIFQPLLTSRSAPLFLFGIDLVKDVVVDIITIISYTNLSKNIAPVAVVKFMILIRTTE